MGTGPARGFSPQAAPSLPQASVRIPQDRAGRSVQEGHRGTIPAPGVTETAELGLTEGRELGDGRRALSPPQLALLPPGPFLPSLLGSGQLPTPTAGVTCHCLSASPSTTQLPLSGARIIIREPQTPEERDPAAGSCPGPPLPPASTSRESQTHDAHTPTTHATHTHTHQGLLGLRCLGRFTGPSAKE